MSGANVIVTFDINNDLYSENAHKSTSIHPRESIEALLESLGKDAKIIVRNQNKFNEIAGLQTGKTPKLLANVELIDDILTNPSEPVNTQFSQEDGREYSRDPFVGSYQDNQGRRYSDRDNSYVDYDKPITMQDVEDLRTISKRGRISVNDFTSQDLQKAQKWAYKFYKELGTKSPFFRAWFGDWRANDGETTGGDVYVNTKHFFKNTSDSSTYIKNGVKGKALFRGDTVNRDTGFKINVGAQVYNDTLTYANRVLARNRNKSDAYALAQYNDRLSILEEVKQICEKSILLDTEVSKNSELTDQSFVHVFYSTATAAGRKYLVRLVVDELNSTHGDIRRAYNLNAIKITPVAVSQVYKPAGATGIDGSSTSTSSISDLYALVKQYDKNFHAGKPVNSGLLNEDGTPKVMYHRTNADFTVFDTSKAKSRQTHGTKMVA